MFDILNTNVEVLQNVTQALENVASVSCHSDVDVLQFFSLFTSFPGSSDSQGSRYSTSDTVQSELAVGKYDATNQYLTDFIFEAADGRAQIYKEFAEPQR